MNIRKPLKTNKRSCCKMCNSEIFKPYFNYIDDAYKDENYDVNNDSHLDDLNIECTHKLEERNKFNLEHNELFVIEARTAQGTQIEMMCRKHVQEIGKLLIQTSERTDI